jgi:hypothetical protein
MRRMKDWHIYHTTLEIDIDDAIAAILDTDKSRSEAIEKCTAIRFVCGNSMLIYHSK